MKQGPGNPLTVQIGQIAEVPAAKDPYETAGVARSGMVRVVTDPVPTNLKHGVLRLRVVQAAQRSMLQS